MDSLAAIADPSGLKSLGQLLLALIGGFVSWMIIKRVLRLIKRRLVRMAEEKGLTWKR